MKRFVFLLFLVSGGAQAVPFANGDAGNGKKLFASYDCNSCHKGKVGGNGNAIYTRPDRTVKSPADLIAQMERCSGAVGSMLAEQQKLDLAAYLNQTYYHFK